MAISNSTDRFNGVVASKAIKVRCVLAAEANVAALTGISNPYEGVFLVENDRILLTAQTNPIENGIWVVNASPNGWTRAADWDGSRDIELGSTVWAGRQAGNDKLWQITSPAGVIVPGTTAVTVSELLDPDAGTATDLQSTTDVGNTTTNDIQINRAAANVTALNITNSGRIVVENTVGDGDINIGSPASDTGQISCNGVINRFQFTGIDNEFRILGGGGITLQERNTQPTAALAGFGYLWLRDDTPNVLMFTDDAGTDIVLSSGAVLPPPTPNGATMYVAGLAWVANDRVQQTFTDLRIYEATITDYMYLTHSGLTAHIGLSDSGHNLVIENDTLIRQGSSFGIVDTLITSGISTVATAGQVDVTAIGSVALDETGFQTTLRQAVTSHEFRIGANNALTIQNNITRVNTDSGGFLEIRDDIGNNIQGSIGTNIISWTPNSANDWRWQFNDGVELRFEEKAAALANVAAYGSLWVRDDAPNVLVFTDDTGVDTVLGGGVSAPIVLLDNEEVQFGNAAGGDWQFRFDGTDMILDKDTGVVQSHLVLESGSTQGPTFELRQTFSSPENSIWFTNTVSGEGFNFAFSPSTGSMNFYAGNDSFAQQQLKMNISGGAVGGVSIYTDASLLRIQTRTQGTQFTQGIYMIEMAAAGADITASGQLWVRNDTPNVLVFTDDAGTDWDLNTIVGGLPGGANTAIQFNNAGAFGGSTALEWDGSEIKVEASQAALILDETDGGGAAFIRLTSTTTGDSAIVIEMDSSTGTDARIRQATSGGTLQDTWIAFAKDGAVTMYFNGTARLATSAVGVAVTGDIFDLNSGADTDTSSFIRNSVGSMTFNVLSTTANAEIRQSSNTGASQDLWIGLTRDGPVTLHHNNVAKLATSANGIDVVGGVYQTELAASVNPGAGSGVFWVRDDAPNTPMFTDDTGVDHVLNAGGGGIGGSITDNQVAVGATTADDIEGSTLLTFDAVDLQVGSTASAVSHGVQAQENSGGIEMRITTAGAGQINQLSAAGALEDNWIAMARNGGVALKFNNVTGISTIADGVQVDDSIYIFEKASANVDAATFGQIWVRDDTPNTLMFTDDAGNDIVLASTGEAAGRRSVNNTAGSLTLATTTYADALVRVLLANTDYMFTCVFDVQAPAADDVKIQFTGLDTSSSMNCSYQESDGNTMAPIWATNAQTVSNEVVIPCNGGSNGQGLGTYVTIQGHISVGASDITLRLRAAKNADAGADGFIRIYRAMQAIPI